MKKQWYVAKTGNHQRIIADENTGESIAVVYEAENADILAAAPDLLKACKAVADQDDRTIDNNFVIFDVTMKKIKNAIRKAEGE